MKKQKKELTTAEKLAQLRYLTASTGALHEAQVAQLKIWPKVLFPCTESTVKVDIENKILWFTVKCSRKFRPNERGNRRAKALEQWCHDLLGKDWVVCLEAQYNGGKKKQQLLKGRRIQEPFRKSDNEPEPILTRRYNGPNLKKVLSTEEEELPDLDLKKLGVE